MLVYVLNQCGKPLMPCKPHKAKKLLREGKANVINRTPFTIQLLFGSTGYKQPIIAGMDTGSKIIGCAAIANDRVIYQSEIFIRQDVSKKMQQRKMYRRTRRGRKCRYRKARWLNRASMRRNGRIAPSIQSKVDSHLREKKQLESILPISHWKVEIASFDIHQITHPNVNGKEYQKGRQLGFYNTKAYILHRDGYQCRSGQKVKHVKKLHIHHIKFKSKGGTDTPENLITLCEQCHKDLHDNKFEFGFELKAKQSKTKHATEIGVIKSQLLKSNWDFEPTFGYETKFKREQILQLPKTHYYDALSICCKKDQSVKLLATNLLSANLLSNILYKRHVAKGDYQQRKGKRSEKKIPTGKLFGLRKFDLIQTCKGVGFVKGKRSSGYFALMDIFNRSLTSSVTIKKNCKRLNARTTTMIQEVAIPPRS